MNAKPIIRQSRMLAVVTALVLAGAAAASAYADSPSRDEAPAASQAPATAASAPAAAAAASGSLEDAEFKVNSGDFRGAIPLLTAIIQREPRNADALNLMGYSLRKTGQPNLALQYYDAALAIAPQNLGANEYLGELYVELGQIDKAKQRLQILMAACGANCVQTQDLSAAIAKGVDPPH
jgi:tetratricopeptide (TPR) repeat protein